jgi:hypothetical protein
MLRKGGTARPLVAACLLLLALVVVAGCGGGGKKGPKLQTVRFQKPTEAGPSPFTQPAEAKGPDIVSVGSGPFGGTGTDHVCDRELLIRSLRARPDRMRAWAEVVGIASDFETVAKYIRDLRPVTITTDIRVTNHSFEGGSATALQSILQAGTTVLVDRYGVPRARCRCGNPLTPPIYYPTARCLYCPPNYHPPAPCTPYSKCYRTYPHPPPVAGTSTNPSPPTETVPTATTPSRQSESPNAYFSPRQGGPDDTYTLFATGFSPNTSLAVTLTRPDGVTEDYTIDTGSDGSGSHTFANNGRHIIGTFTAVVRNPQTGASTTASTTVVDDGAGGGSGTTTSAQ